MHERPTLRAAIREPWVLAFMSMDLVRAFYGMMGLHPSVHAAVQRVFVDVTLLTRKQLEAHVTNGSPPPTFEWQCEYVERSLGHDVTQHLIWWLNYLLPIETSDGAALDDWMYILRYCDRDSTEMWLSLGLPKQLSAAVRARLAAVNREKYNERTAEVEAKPISDWDLHLYASQLLIFDDDLEGTGYDPRGYIAGSVRAYQGYQFWDWLLKATTEAQQAELRENALQIVRQEELKSVKDLVAPIRLGIGV